MLTDQQYEFGITLGFIDLDENTIERGFTAVNSDSNNMVVEVDYLVGENRDKVIEILEEL